MTTQINGTLALAWFTSFAQDFDSAQAGLTELDRLAGDGDFGTNISSALGRAHEALPAESEATFNSVFKSASSGFMATGGTSGPLFGMWFRSIAKSATDESASLSDLAAGIADGLATIQKLGGAKVGDNTMVDALEPASVALSASAEQGSTLAEGLLAAAQAARKGAESTEELIAARGRASYVGELARGVLDPGAVTVALFFQAGANTIGEPQEWTPLITAKS